MNGYGAISDNYEAANIFYIVRFTSVPYILQEDVRSYGNQLVSSYLVFNAIYASPGWYKSQFYANLYN